MAYKALLINGSPRKHGNTRQALNIVGDVLTQNGIESQTVQLGGMRLYGCQACGACSITKNGLCAYGDKDGLNEILPLVWQADALIIGSPTYYSGITAEVKAFIDRCGYVSGANGGLLLHKIGAPVVAVRRAGANVVYAQINYLFGISQMPIATSSYWNMTVACLPGEIQNDAEGIATFRTLGENIAWMVQKLR